MSNQSNPSQQHASSSHQNTNPSQQPSLLANPEFREFLFSKPDVRDKKSAAFSDILVADYMRPFSLLCKPPFSVSQSDLLPVLYSYVSYMSAGQIAWPCDKSEQTNRARLNELAQWRSVCPNAPQLFRDVNRVSGSTISVEERVAEVGTQMWKRACFNGCKQSYRDFHHYGLGLRNAPTLRQHYYRLLQGVNAAGGSQQLTQMGQQTHSTSAPGSRPDQYTLPQSVSNQGQAPYYDLPAATCNGEPDLATFNPANFEAELEELFGPFNQEGQGDQGGFHTDGSVHGNFTFDKPDQWDGSSATQQWGNPPP